MNDTCKAVLGVVMLASCSHPQAVSSGAGGPPVRTLLEVRHISVSIDRLPQDVYDFASNIENLPEWATGLGKNIRNVAGEWIADGPTGPVKVRLVRRNGVSERKFAEDAKWVTKDLRLLKSLLER
jgi:uncharacterized membrane protein